MPDFRVSTESPENDFHGNCTIIKASDEEEAALTYCEDYFVGHSLYELGSCFSIWVAEQLSEEKSAVLFRQFEITVESQPIFYAEEIR